MAELGLVGMAGLSVSAAPKLQAINGKPVEDGKLLPVIAGERQSTACQLSPAWIPAPPHPASVEISHTRRQTNVYAELHSVGKHRLRVKICCDSVKHQSFTYRGV